MKTYAEKTRTREWRDFSEDYKHRRAKQMRSRGQAVLCDGCSGHGPFETHHRRYHPGREPWEYDDEDLALLCSKCHRLFHGLADNLYSWAISMEPDAAEEMKYMVGYLVTMRCQRAALHNCVRMLEAVSIAEDSGDVWEVNP